MNKFLAQLKEYWFLLVFIIGGVTGLVSLVTTQYVGDIAMTTLKSDAAKLYVQGLVTEELKGRGITTGSKISEMTGDITENAAEIVEVKQDVGRVEDKAERIAQILMTED